MAGFFYILTLREHIYGCLIELAEKYATICIEDLNLTAMQREPSPLHHGHATGTVPVASQVVVVSPEECQSKPSTQPKA